MNFFKKTINSIESLYYNINNGLKNLIEWFPVVWKDRDWDSYYIYKVMIFKIKKQMNSMDKYGMHLYKDRDLKYMRICIALLERIVAENYLHENYWAKKIDERFGEFRIIKGRGFCHERCITDEDKKLEKYWSTKSYKLADYLLKQDFELFGKIFARQSKNWWD